MQTLKQAKKINLQYQQSLCPGMLKRISSVIRLSLVFAVIIISYLTSEEQAMAKDAKTTSAVQHNKLIHEKSPYLLQHAHNPVQWYPWGPEAFEKARKEDKPILLSIGYSTCHWCHVMADESFEDAEVARLMNELFVCIKVDREERPDIDSVYMAVCQIMTGSGGWPLTIIMTPDKKPFFAATYIPKKTRFGRMGMLDLIPRISKAWATKRDELLRSADKITGTLQELNQNDPGGEPGADILKSAYESLSMRFDEDNGGFGTAPKFPTPHNMFFLLRYWKRTGDKKALKMVESTLLKMRMGGIYDHIGYGFHRYSTDSRWLVPHFEKMIYDQALLAMAYTEAFQATERKDFEQTVHEIFDYVLRHMTAPDGGFFSAEDADSEGREGKFYLWKIREIRQILSEKEADLIIKFFNMNENGNFSEEATRAKTGENILHITQTVKKLASEINMPEQELLENITSSKKKLFYHREKRIHPHRDDKILTDWNGLTIAAFAKAGRVFNEPEFTMAAKRAADFILKNLQNPEGRLLHRYRDGHTAVSAQIDDYAFLIWGLLELYETAFDAHYLQAALDLNTDLIRLFWDDVKGGFFSTADDAEALLIRQKESYDGATPSGNSVAMLNLLRISRITAKPEFEEKAEKIGRFFSKSIKQSPSAHTQLMNALDFTVGPSYEVVIAGRMQSADTKEMLKSIRKHFIPNKVMIFRPTDQETPEIVRISGFTKHQTGISNRATAYVCQNFNCKYPTTDITKALELLNVK